MNRIGYIGSKLKLKDWIFEEISKRTDDTYTKFADLFAGSCIMTHEALEKKYECISNDLETYSYVIMNGLRCPFSDKLQNIIKTLDDLDTKDIVIPGFVTLTYSPRGNRMYFTEDNAMRIDIIRENIERMKDRVSTDEYNFLLASLLTSADSVKNTSVVYGAYLKKFKKTALKRMVFAPLHTRSTIVTLETFNEDATELGIKTDIAYVDPPYNSRQYGANYFVLNQILTPKEIGNGVTGLPEYKKSSFCRKQEVATSFCNMLKNVSARLFVISYSSESLLSKEEMVALLSQYGKCEVVVRNHKRFKAQISAVGNDVEEYLFFVYIVV